MKRFAVALAFFAACQTSPPAPTPIVPVVDADATPCDVLQRVDQARLIREPDGATFDRPCPDAGP